MYEWSRKAAYVFMSLSTFKDINQSCLYLFSIEKQKLGNNSLFSKILEMGMHVHRCIWYNIWYQRAHFLHEESSKQMKLGSTSKKKQKKKPTWNMIWNCSNSIYVLLHTFPWSINLDNAEIILLPLSSGRRNANTLDITIHFLPLLETHVSHRGFFLLLCIWLVAENKNNCTKTRESLCINKGKPQNLAKK